MADGADDRLRPRLRARAPARRARRVGGDGDRHLRALDRLPAAGVEDARQDVREATEVGRGRAAGAARARAAERVGGAEQPAAVVALALLRVREHVVGLGDLLEAVLRAGVLVRVRVVLARELAVGLLDLVLGRLLLDAQRLVV